MKSEKTLITVVGATAVGKTNLCIRLAQKLNTEIISADSRQFFQEMNIGTAKPNENELKMVKHHLIDSHSIKEKYDVRQYEKDVLAILEGIFKEKNTAIITGGSGLYVKTICEGIDEMPHIPSKIRNKLIQEYQEKGIAFLQNELKNIDPEYYEKVDLQNPQRLMRALEVSRFTGKTYSSFRTQKKVKRPFHILKIGLERPREELYERINLRMDKMLEKGLLKEVKSLEKYKSHNALQTLGYQEIFDFLDQKQDWEETVRLLKQNSRRYAKRQMTWFRRDKEIRWFSSENFEDIWHFIEENLPLDKN